MRLYVLPSTQFPIPSTLFMVYFVSIFLMISPILSYIHQLSCFLFWYWYLFDG